MNRRLLSTAALLGSLFLPMIGCGAGSMASNATPATAGMSGKVIGGQNPISGSTVTVWQVGAEGPTMLANTTSAADGSFNIPAGSYACVSSNPQVPAQVYVTAAGGQALPGYNNPNILLAAGLGNCSTTDDQVVNINEVTTAVTAYALATFFIDNNREVVSPAEIGVSDERLPALAVANVHLIPTLVNLALGTVNPNTSSITIESAKIYSIANVIAACVNSASSSNVCSSLFTYTAEGQTQLPTADTLAAAVSMARFPYQNVTALYQLSIPQAPFAGLATAPNDWSLAISYTTPIMGLGIAGTATSATSSTLDIDAQGRVWFPSNLPGATGAGYFDPTTNSFSGPFSAQGLTMLQPQYLAIDTSGYVWVTDLLSPNLLRVDSSGITAPKNYPVAGALGTGPVSLDFSGDPFFAYTDIAGASDLGFILAGTSSVSTLGTFVSSPTGLEWFTTAQGNGVYAVESGSDTSCYAEALSQQAGKYTQTYFNDLTSDCQSGGVSFYDDSDNPIGPSEVYSSGGVYLLDTEYAGYFIPSATLNLPQGIELDAGGVSWIGDAGSAAVSGYNTNVGDSSEITKIPTLPYLHGPENGNTMTAPYGIGVDRAGNIWVTNASCVTTTVTLCTPGPLVLSEIIGSASGTLTPLSAQDGGSKAGLLIN